MPNYHLSYEQKVILKKLNQWLDEKRIPSEWKISISKNRALIGFLSRDESDIWAFIDHTIDPSTINAFVDCSFFVKLENENFLISKFLLQEAIDNNFGDSHKENKSHLNQEQWAFLKIIKSAIYGKYLTQKSETGFYIRPIQEERKERIISFDGFAPIFADAHKNELAISLKDFLHLETLGYLKKAKNGHYYIIANRILPAVEDYLAQGTEQKATPVTNSSAFRLPDTSAQFQCDIFMVMPFRDELKPVYADHIKPLVEGLKYEIKRGDDTFSHHDIITEIWSLINNAKLIIADCTGKNANVFYELGLAHAIDKPVIIITQNEEDIPFDIRQRRYIKYEYTPRGMKQFEEDLRKAIQSILGS